MYSVVQRVIRFMEHRRQTDPTALALSMFTAGYVSFSVVLFRPSFGMELTLWLSPCHEGSPILNVESLVFTPTIISDHSEYPSIELMTNT